MGTCACYFAQMELHAHTGLPAPHTKPSPCWSTKPERLENSALSNLDSYSFHVSSKPIVFSLLSCYVFNQPFMPHNRIIAPNHIQSAVNLFTDLSLVLPLSLEHDMQLPALYRFLFSYSYTITWIIPVHTLGYFSSSVHN